jgi:diguanylate cyclase (GGDEF)-like protein
MTALADALDRSDPRRLDARAVVMALLIVASCAAVTTSAGVSYAVRGVTALAAALVFLRSARHGGDQALSNYLGAGALLVGAAAGGLAVLQLAVTGAHTAPGGVVDYVYLAHAPFAVAALLTLPGRPGGRMRTIADGAVAAGSMWIIALMLIIEPTRLGAGLEGAAQLGTLARVLLPAFVLAVAFSAVARTLPVARPFLVRISAGMTLLGVTDALIALGNWQGTFRATSVIVALNQLGLALLLVVGVTRLADHRRAATVAVREARKSWLGGVLPYLPLLGALIVAVANYAKGNGITRAETPAVLLIAAGVLLRHVSALLDHGRLVSELETSEREARAEALRDPLTGLANRNAFLAHLADRLTDPAARPVAVALLDLNNFKDINDTHGHDTGDVLLQRCAERLAAVTPAGGLVARLGGDEFALCQPAAGDGGAALLRSVEAAFGTPLAIGQRRFSLRPSVGIVVDERVADSSATAEAMHLLAHADVAMYEAKGSKDTGAPAGVVLTGAARTRAAALIRLREEISQPDLGQFHVVYQPVVELGTGTISGVEALLRWNHPELGQISPVEFIPLSEQVGSVGVLGEFVLATAAADLAGWQALAPTHPLSVGVNLSPRQLVDPELPGRVLALIAAHGLRPDQLLLEITETALVADLDIAVGLVAELRDAGISVAVDDFGTGYSSLRYLRRFPADIVKIDREFVQAVVGEPRTAALVKSVVDMAVALDLRTVAEGIETVEQLGVIQSLGCQSGQGYLFSRPVEAGAIAALLAVGHRYPVDTSGLPAVPAPHRVPRRPGRLPDLHPTGRRDLG